MAFDYLLRILIEAIAPPGSDIKSRLYWAEKTVQSNGLIENAAPVM